MNVQTKKEKREKYEKLAKKSFVFKPLVFRKIYKYSKKARQDAIKKYIEKYTNSNNLTKKEITFFKRDIAYCKVVYNILYSEYFLYDFKNKNYFQRKSFLANPNRQDYLYLLGNEEGQSNLRDKWQAYNILKKFYKREIIKITSDKDFDLFKKYVLKHPVFVKKPLDASFGKGIELIDTKKTKKIKELFQSLISEGTFLMEELIKSNTTMSSLHNESLNTIRVVTYRDENENIHIHLPFIKIGKGGSFVDNGGAGGLFARIDEKTGTIITDGKDEDNIVYEYHPDTNVKIKGFQIPKWDEIVSLAKEAALSYRDTRYIGWDIALSIDKGALIVEGNGKTQFFGQQMVDEIGKRKSMERLINYKELKKKNKNVERWELPPIKCNKSRGSDSNEK